MSASIDRARSLVLAVIATLRTSARDRAVDAIASDGAIPEAMAKWALDAACDAYSEQAVLERHSELRYAGEHVAVLMARSVPIAPLRAVLLPLLWGAASLRVRPPRNARRFTALLAEVVRAEQASIDLTFEDSPGAAFVAGLNECRTDRLVAFGSDEALAAIRDTLGVETLLEAKPHGFGIAIAEPHSLEDPTVADALVRDIAAFEQQGCLSPQCVFVRNGDAIPAAQRLHAALTRLDAEWPQHARAPDEAIASRTWLGSIGAVSHEVLRTETHAVAALEQTRFVSSPGRRHVAVVPANDQALVRVLAPHERHLTVIIRAADAPDLLLAPHARRVRPGDAQRPPLDGWEDARPAAITRR